MVSVCRGGRVSGENASHSEGRSGTFHPVSLWRCESSGYARCCAVGLSPLFFQVVESLSRRFVVWQREDRCFWLHRLGTDSVRNGLASVRLWTWFRWVEVVALPARMRVILQRAPTYLAPWVSEGARARGGSAAATQVSPRCFEAVGRFTVRFQKGDGYIASLCRVLESFLFGEAVVDLARAPSRGAPSL